MHNCNFDNQNDNESIYDKHQSNIRSYEQNPVQIVEKFDNSTQYDIQHMLKWILILLIVVAIVYLVYYICCNMNHRGEKVVTLTYTPLSYDSSSFNLF